MQTDDNIKAGNESQAEANTDLPRHNRTKGAVFTLFVALALLVNIACGIVSYAIYSRGAILEDLYDYLVSHDITFFVWATAGASLLGALFTLLAYILSFDYRRPSRPLVRLWILFTSFAMSIAGLLLGMAGVDPDNVAAILGAVIAGFILPLPVIYLEKIAGKGALKSARRFLASHAAASARASSRTALTLRPGNPEALTMYGLAAAAAGRYAQALPYLVYAEQQGAPSPDIIAALADAWEFAGDHRKTIKYLDMLPAEHATPDMLDRKIRLWLEAGHDERALEALRTLDGDWRKPWRPDYQRLLVQQRDRESLYHLCTEIQNDDEAPYEKTVECLKAILNLFPADTRALEKLIDIQKELKQRDTVAALQEELLTIEEDRLDVRRELVSYYWEHGNRVKLVRHLNRVLLSGQATTDEKLRLLEETFTEGDYLRIEELVTREEDLSLNARALAILANALYQGGRNEESLERIAQAKRFNPNEKLCHNLDALAAKIKKNVLSEELSDLEQKAAGAPADLDLKFDYLDRLVASKMADRVVVQLDDLLNAQPELQDRVEKEIRVMLSRHGKNRRLMEYLGDLYLRRRDFDKAYEVYERRAQGEMESAEILHDAVQRILALNPDHAPSLRSEMNYFYNADDPVAALENIDKYEAAGNEPDAEIRTLEMQAAEKAGNATRALSSGEVLLAAQPEQPELLSKVAALAREQGDFSKAIAYLQKAVEVDPDSFDWRRQLRDAVETMKKNRMAEIRNALSEHPGNRDLLEEMGDLHHDFDQLNEAIASYQRAGINDSERRVPKAKQGYVLARKGLFTDADEILQEADLRSDLSEDEQEKLKNLFFITAQLMEEEDEQERALELYRRIFRVDAGYRDVVDHVERLQVTNKKKRQQHY